MLDDLKGLQLVHLARESAKRLGAGDVSNEIAIPDYELLQKLGVGRFGTVWLARNVHDKHYCAIKILAELAETEIRGIQEYQKRVGANPGLIPVRHVGKSKCGFYYVMPLADNANGSTPITESEVYEPLTLHRHIKRQGKLPSREVLRIACDILEGLNYLHEVGGVHRDVKPENILRLNERWVLSDHGLLCDSENPPSVAGTKGFHSPELLQDASNDLFGLGKTMYLALTGLPLGQFQRFVDSSDDDREKDPLFQDVRAIICRACADSPSRRYSSSKSMLADCRVNEKQSNGLYVVASISAIFMIGLFIWLTQLNPGEKDENRNGDRTIQSRDVPTVNSIECKSSFEVYQARVEDKIDLHAIRLNVNRASRYIRLASRTKAIV